MKRFALLSILALAATANVAHAVDPNEFLVSKAWAYANTRSTAHGHDTDFDYHEKVGAPRHNVSAYRLMMRDLFGFQFQCATSSVWAKEYDENEHPDEFQVYLSSGALRYSGPEDGFSPHSVASWKGTILVREVSEYELEYFKRFFHQQVYGSEITHRIIVRLTNLVEGRSQEIILNFTDDYVGYSPSGPSSGAVDTCLLPPGVQEITIIVESYFSKNAFYSGFESIQGGVYVWMHRAN